MDIGKNRSLDLRLLTGILFTLYGLILAIYGLAADPRTASTRWNIDLWWGIVDLLFGLVFLFLSRRPQRLDD